MAKIPFSIEHREKIESGEYKVETRDGKPTRIVCWDLKGNEDFFFLALVEKNEKEVSYCYPTTGCCKAACDREGKDDLFIVTPEPELTEFEKAIETICTNLASGIDKVDNVKRIAAELLELAKKELCNSCNENLEGYIKGREDARKEMEYEHEGPFWPLCINGGDCTNPFRDCINCPRGATTVGFNTTTGTSTSKVEEKK